jgi:hypothetical protein
MEQRTATRTSAEAHRGTMRCGSLRRDHRPSGGPRRTDAGRLQDVGGTRRL